MMCIYVIYRGQRVQQR